MVKWPVKKFIGHLTWSMGSRTVYLSSQTPAGHLHIDAVQPQLKTVLGVFPNHHICMDEQHNDEVYSTHIISRQKTQSLNSSVMMDVTLGYGRLGIDGTHPMSSPALDILHLRRSTSSAGASSLLQLIMNITALTIHRVSQNPQRTFTLTK